MGSEEVYTGENRNLFRSLATKSSRKMGWSWETLELFQHFSIYFMPPGMISEHPKHMLCLKDSTAQKRGMMYSQVLDNSSSWRMALPLLGLQAGVYLKVWSSGASLVELQTSSFQTLLCVCHLESQLLERIWPGLLCLYQSPQSCCVHQSHVKEVLVKM